MQADAAMWDEKEEQCIETHFKKHIWEFGAEN